ncbi:MAG: hypothetical protein L0271_17025 [Gemmatimonadetes bacterium]|nr:hypothetical protein [Gemmatimonadota bacterium]
MTPLSPKDRDRLQTLETFSNRLHHLRALVEKLAVERGDNEAVSTQCRRAFNQFKLQLTGAGFDTIAIQCGALELTARRGMPQGAKVRMLRDGVGNLTRMLDLERRQIMTASQRAKAHDSGDAAVD